MSRSLIIHVYLHSWDEIARYDIPAMLNFVLKKTEQPSLYYVGHSQGTLVAFAELSRNLDLAKKVKSFYAMGPLTTISHMKSPIKYLAYLTPEIQVSGWETMQLNDWLAE